VSRAAWAGAALAALTACSDGYRGDGEPLRLHYDMTRQETLDAMGRVTTRATGGTASFALQDDCVLAWRTEKRGLSTPLVGLEAQLVKRPDSERYRVQLTWAAGSDDTPGLVLLDGAHWAEATQMKWLWNYVRRFC